MCRSYHHSEWSNEDTVATVFLLSPLRLSINRLATPLGIDESLAFRVFDKTIIFGHWLWKTRKLALASRAFLLKNTFTISQQTIFKRAKIFFQKKTFSKREDFSYFQHGALPLSSHALLFSLHALPFSSHALLLSSHALQLSFTCKHRVEKFNFCYTFICFPQIYIYIYIYMLCFEKSLSPSLRIA